MENVGEGNDASAKAPTGTAMNPGILSTSKKTVDPQVGQNRKVIVLPASPTRTYDVAAPTIVTFSADQRAC